MKRKPLGLKGQFSLIQKNNRVWMEFDDRTTERIELVMWWLLIQLHDLLESLDRSWRMHAKYSSETGSKLTMINIVWCNQNLKLIYEFYLDKSITIILTTRFGLRL